MRVTTDDDIKQQLLDALSQESLMVLSTAYVYAKNCVEYGEDITKAWITATQQAYVMREVRQKAWAEAYASFKKDYETRLKAEKYVMLDNIRNEFIDRYPHNYANELELGGRSCVFSLNEILRIIDKYRT